MFNSLTRTSSLAAGLALIGGLVLLPQQASAGRFGGFHGGGAPHIAIARPAFHPAFRPAFHSLVRPAAGHRGFGGARYAHDGGLGRHAGGRGHERSRLSHLDRHMHYPHGRIATAFYQPDQVEPDAVAPVVILPAVAGVGVSPESGAAPAGAPVSRTQIDRTAACAAGGSFVQVTFAPKATATDISNFLKAYNVTIFDGPAQDGRYRVRLSGTSLPPNEVIGAVQSMQSQTAIVSAVSVL